MGHPRRLTPAAEADLELLAGWADLRAAAVDALARVETRIADRARSAMDNGAPATVTADAADVSRRTLERIMGGRPAVTR